MKVSLCIPTRNEENNIVRLLDRIAKSMEGIEHEVLVVDDSDNNMTMMLAAMNGAKIMAGQHKGLAQAVIDGIKASESEYIIVMDADLQHKPELLPEVVNKLDRYDLVIVTKHAKEANAELSRWRKLQSNLGVLATHKLIPAPVSDPMSGFFGVRRKCIEGVELEGIGFKIGLEIIVKAKWVSHYEIPMNFVKREAGVSKGTAHSLQKHLYHLWQWHLENRVELPKGSEEYYYFYEGTDWQKDWKQSIALVLQNITRGLDPQRLLDCGGGSSPNVNYMWGKTKAGMDIRPKALEFMRQHSEAEFIEGSVLDIPYPEASFDTVACVEVLEHLYPDEVDNAVSEIVRVLQPKGYAILATPNYSSPLWNVIENAQKMLQPSHWTSDHHTKFNHKSLRDLCLTYGLNEIRYDGVMSNMDMVVTYKKE